MLHKQREYVQVSHPGRMMQNGPPATPGVLVPCPAIWTLRQHICPIADCALNRGEVATRDGLPQCIVAGRDHLGSWCSSTAVLLDTGGN
mmetsp:Transcript_11737/g.27367  ORF Transcript_11737/g.27367 Transcript_11737/m.27367 type:complete len:89 (-) Transcript_11737:15-281(-)